MIRTGRFWKSNPLSSGYAFTCIAWQQHTEVILSYETEPGRPRRICLKCAGVSDNDKARLGSSQRDVQSPCIAEKTNVAFCV